jgi:hypothetical protein
VQGGGRDEGKGGGVGRGEAELHSKVGPCSTSFSGAASKHQIRTMEVDGHFDFTVREEGGVD